MLHGAGPELEKKYQSTSAQATFNDGPTLKKIPVFDVTWGGPENEDSPPIGVKIFGPTKELISLRMEDTRFSKRPPLVITNALELNNLASPSAETNAAQSRLPLN